MARGGLTVGWSQMGAWFAVGLGFRVGLDLVCSVTGEGLRLGVEGGALPGEALMVGGGA